MTQKLNVCFTKIVAVFFMTTLVGCSVRLQWFVRNFTDKDVKITLRYDNKIEKYYKVKLPKNTKFLNYKKEIVKINQSTESLLIDSIVIINIDSSSYQILLPAKSTIELTQIIPTNYSKYSNVIAEFEQDGLKYSINSIDIFEKHSVLKRTGGLTIKNLIYYDYKPKTIRD